MDSYGLDVDNRQINVTDGGVPSTAGTLFFKVPEAAGDGDDYMEGNGGDDLMYGGLGQDDIRDVERREDDDRVGDVGEDVAEHDPGIARSDSAGGRDEVAFGNRRRFGAYEPRETRPRVIRALRMLENKVDTMPRKKHGNIPL